MVKTLPFYGENSGSNPDCNKICALYTGVWCNGSMPVSKTVDGGSNPSTPAKISFLIFIKKYDIIFI